MTDKLYTVTNDHGDPWLVQYEYARANALKAFEAQYAKEAIDLHGSVSRAADAAGMDRVYLHRLMKRAGIKLTPEQKRAAIHNRLGKKRKPAELEERLEAALEAEGDAP
jgi:hypothetical protein